MNPNFKQYPDLNHEVKLAGGVDAYKDKVHSDGVRDGATAVIGFELLLVAGYGVYRGGKWLWENVFRSSIIKTEESELHKEQLKQAVLNELEESNDTVPNNIEKGE